VQNLLSCALKLFFSSFLGTGMMYHKLICVVG